MRTLVVGAAIVDLMMKVERLPKSGEDIPCKETKTVVGGCAYNVANTLRNLKCEHDLCVPVGSGSFADIIRRGMKEEPRELAEKICVTMHGNIINSLKNAENMAKGNLKIF